jgi:hypothetical protein
MIRIAITQAAYEAIADKLIALARLTEWIAMEEASWLPEPERRQ